ncbi:MAG: hypothetical protein P8Y68_20510 [Anaerolineales bacterium]
MIKAALLLDQSRSKWKDLNCLWSQSRKPYPFPEIVEASEHADCYLVIAAPDITALGGLILAKKKSGFDPHKPVIWIDPDQKLADVFGSTSQLIDEIRTKERATERNIRRLIARLLVS